jgi:RNA polymerase sigma factor (sigma-70 family)
MKRQPPRRTVAEALTLFEETRWLALYVARRTCALYRWRDIEDARQEALIALWRAARLFDETRAGRFVSYARRALDLTFLNLRRDERRRPHFMGWPPPGDDGEAFDVPDCREPLPEDAAEQAQVGDLLASLDERQRAMVLGWAEGRGLGELGQEFRISKQHVSNIVREALARLARAHARQEKAG